MGIPWLTLLKWILLYVGPLVAAAALYLKGMSAGKASNQQEVDAAAEKQKQNLAQAEAANQVIEKERYDNVEKIRDASNNPSKSVELFNEGPWGTKHSNSPSDKKTS